MMPSEDFFRMTDQELSDVVAYIQSLPPVDRHVLPRRIGPVGKVLLALEKLPLSATVLTDHYAAHAAVPPPAAPTAEFGAHLAQICTGCHRHDFSGGPHPAGPPDWLPAANLTPANEAFAQWSFEEFDATMRTGVRPDGTEVGVPMTEILPVGKRMTEVEMRALYAFLHTLEPATGVH